MDAVDRGHAESAAMLIRKGARLERTPMEGSTALMLATRSKRVGCMLTCRGRADVEQANRRGETPLLACSFVDHLQTARCLLDPGRTRARPPRPDAADRKGLVGHANTQALLAAAWTWTRPTTAETLFGACTSGHARCVSALSQRGRPRPRRPSVGAAARR